MVTEIRFESEGAVVRIVGTSDQCPEITVSFARSGGAEAWKQIKIGEKMTGRLGLNYYRNGWTLSDVEVVKVKTAEELKLESVERERVEVDRRQMDVLRAERERVEVERRQRDVLRADETERRRRKDAE